MLVAAFTADRVLGDPARLHPVAGFGAVAAAVERALWRPSRVAGLAYALVLVGAVAAASSRVPRRFGVVVVWATLGGRSLERAAREMADALRADDVAQARAIAPRLVGRDPAALDADGLVRATIESVAENTSDAVVAPLLWAALTGPTGAATYRAINTLDAMVGHRNERWREFGWASARLDDLANWPAARLTAALAAVAGGRPRAALRAAAHDARDHPSPNAGVVEAAFAGALDVRLGGTIVYAHGTEQRHVLGGGRTPTVADIDRAVRLARVVGAAAACACALVAARGRR